VFRTAILAITLLFPLTANSASISGFDVQGNSRISNSTIQSYLKLRLDEPYEANLANDSVKALYQTGFFSDVKVIQDGTVVLVKVVENPLVGKIVFEGNKKLNDSELKKEINMHEYSVYSASGVASDVHRIKTLYQRKGRYNAMIEPKIIKLDNNRINLIYEINEGTQSKIRSINFLGNDQYSSNQLSSVISSKEHRFYNIFSSDDIFDENRLLYDQELLRHYYMSEGFADFYVSSVDTELSSKQDAFIITFNLYEGDIYRYGDFRIDCSIPAVNKDVVKKLISAKKGEMFNLTQIEETVDAITNYLGDHGYAFVNVDFDINKNKALKETNVIFTIGESKKLYINRIDIKNNTRTLDKVVRREFRINEGDPYNLSKIQRSQQRIRSLGFFNNVEFKNLQTEHPDKVDIEVDVEEKSTGSLNFAAGYNTAEGPVGQIGASEKNFLGRGQEVDLSLSKAKRSLNIDFSFTEPYFLDRPLIAGFDVFRRTQSSTHQNSYHSKTVGLDLRMGYNITEFLIHNMHYMIKSDNIYSVPSDVAKYVSPGKYATSMVGHSLIYDKLDDRNMPTSGYRIQLSQDYAGLGGKTRYIKHGIDAKKYFPIYKKSVVLSLSVAAGNIYGWGKKQVRLNDRYFIGSDQFRGFEQSGIGPKGISDEESIGGTTYYVASTELNFPLGLPSDLGVKGAAFIDAGSLFGNTKHYKDIYSDKYLRASYGVGIIWNSSLASIRIDYGIPFRKKFYDDTQRIRLQIGRQF
jgi:outer membrane protein insertion porin family